jgi:hypothetical protein
MEEDLGYGKRINLRNPGLFSWLSIRISSIVCETKFYS